MPCRRALSKTIERGTEVKKIDWTPRLTHYNMFFGRFRSGSPRIPERNGFD